MRGRIVAGATVAPVMPEPCPAGQDHTGPRVGWPAVQPGKTAKARHTRNWTRSPLFTESNRGAPVPSSTKEHVMNSIIYIVGLVVVVLFILSMLGLR